MAESTGKKKRMGKPCSLPNEYEQENDGYAKDLKQEHEFPPLGSQQLLTQSRLLTTPGGKERGRGEANKENPMLPRPSSCTIVFPGNGWKDRILCSCCFLPLTVLSWIPVWSTNYVPVSTLHSPPCEGGPLPGPF